MMIEPAELFRLALGLIVLPVILLFTRRLRNANWARPMVAAYCVITASYVLSIIEVFVAPDLFNMLQHLMYFIAGILWVRAVIGMRTSGYLSVGSK